MQHWQSQPMSWMKGISGAPGPQSVLQAQHIHSIPVILATLLATSFARGKGMENERKYRGHMCPRKQQSLSETILAVPEQQNQGLVLRAGAQPMAYNVSVENPREIMLVVSRDKAGHTQGV